MRIDADFQPIGPEAMLQRLREFQSQAPAAGPAFQLPDGGSGLTGSLGGANGLAPLNPKGLGMSLSPDKAPAKFSALIEKAAGENGIDPLLLDAVVATESSYDPNCRSRAGAMGLTQLMPGDLKELGVTNPFDPAQNLQGGARQLSQYIARYPGNLGLALAAYNAGPAKVDKYGGIPPYTETQNYVKKVIDLYHAKQAQP
jgi:soluble lytic murein transglycosylase-like protein